MATKREMADHTVFFSVLGHKKFIHKILAKSESVHFQPLFKFFGALRELLLKHVANTNATTTNTWGSATALPVYLYRQAKTLIETSHQGLSVLFDPRSVAAST